MRSRLLLEYFDMKLCIKAWESSYTASSGHERSYRFLVWFGSSHLEFFQDGCKVMRFASRKALVVLQHGAVATRSF